MAEVTARQTVVAHAVDSGHPTSIHFYPDPKLDTNPDVNEGPFRKYMTLVKHSSIELPNEDGKIPVVSQELKAVQPARYIN